jgi:hypothetical protein
VDDNNNNQQQQLCLPLLLSVRGLFGSPNKLWCVERPGVLVSFVSDSTRVPQLNCAACMHAPPGFVCWLVQSRVSVRECGEKVCTFATLWTCALACVETKILTGSFSNAHWLFFSNAAQMTLCLGLVVCDLLCTKELQLYDMRMVVPSKPSRLWPLSLSQNQNQHQHTKNARRCLTRKCVISQRYSLQEMIVLCVINRV